MATGKESFPNLVIGWLALCLLPFLFPQVLVFGWNAERSLVSRRNVLATATGTFVTTSFWPTIASSAEGEGGVVTSKVGFAGGDYENRDRKSNKDAVIREDYYYMMGKTPPRLLNGPIKADDPQWNAFGSCETTEGGSASNSCTYVSLKQRIPAYSKYGFSIALGAKEYGQMKSILQQAADTNSEQAWVTAATYVSTLPQTPPPPPVDALLKMVLFASAVLTSPNYSGPNRELLVARFYVNEASFATKEMARAIDARDGPRALAAWEFGKDSWNSYFQIVNEKISPKVGDKFVPIQ